LSHVIGGETKSYEKHVEQDCDDCQGCGNLHENDEKPIVLSDDVERLLADLSYTLVGIGILGDDLLHL